MKFQIAIITMHDVEMMTDTALLVVQMESAVPMISQHREFYEYRPLCKFFRRTNIHCYRF